MGEDPDCNTVGSVGKLFIILADRQPVCKTVDTEVNGSLLIYCNTDNSVGNLFNLLGEASAPILQDC